MSNRSEWQATKTKAKKLNGNRAFKFPRDMKLGDALDKVDTSEKAFTKASGKEKNAAWAKAADAYFQAAAAANTAASTYYLALGGLDLTPEAHKVLDSELSVNLMRNMTKIIKEGRRIEPQLARVRAP